MDADVLEFTFMINGQVKFADGKGAVMPLYELGFSESNLTRNPDVTGREGKDEEITRARLRGASHSIGVQIAAGAIMVELRGKEMENVFKESDAFMAYIFKIGLTI